MVETAPCSYNTAQERVHYEKTIIEIMFLCIIVIYVNTIIAAYYGR